MCCVIFCFAHISPCTDIGVSLHNHISWNSLLGIGLRTSGMRISTRAWYKLLSQSRLQRSTGSYLHSITRQDFGRRFSDSSWLTRAGFRLYTLCIKQHFDYKSRFWNVWFLSSTTHTANVASPAWLWLNLQKVFHRVSTRVNWRLTITSSMAWQNTQKTSHTYISKVIQIIKGLKREIKQDH